MIGRLRGWRSRILNTASVEYPNGGVHWENVSSAVPADLDAAGTAACTVAAYTICWKNRCAAAPKVVAVTSMMPMLLREAFHPKLRSLVNTAWARYHLANDKEADGFFASDTVEV